MSDMKCPFCGKPIRYLGTDLFTCDKCHIMLPAKHWLAYINTRKALDVAVDMLKLVYQGNGDPQDIMRYKDNRWTAVRRLCKQALEQITALEQKDHFAGVSKMVEQKDVK